VWGQSLHSLVQYLLAAIPALPGIILFVIGLLGVFVPSSSDQEDQIGKILWLKSFFL
jgi:hypothetical protein